MGRRSKSIIIVVGSIIGLLVISIVCVIASISISDHRQRNFISQRLNIFKAPQGCSESGREYQKADIDAAPTWYISYNCRTTGGQAYNQVTTNLIQRNFVLHGDFSKGDAIDGIPVKSISYDFTYWGDGVMAEYKFLPDTSVSVNDKEALSNSQVTSIGLSVSKLPAH